MLLNSFTYLKHALVSSKGLFIILHVQAVDLCNNSVTMSNCLNKLESNAYSEDFKLPTYLRNSRCECINSRKNSTNLNRDPDEQHSNIKLL